MCNNFVLFFYLYPFLSFMTCFQFFSLRVISRTHAVRSCYHIPDIIDTNKLTLVLSFPKCGLPFCVCRIIGNINDLLLFN